MAGDYAGINPGVENINHDNYNVLMYRIRNAAQLLDDGTGMGLGICDEVGGSVRDGCELIIDIATPNQEFEIHLVP
jgi:hypothetical protein